MSDQPQGKSLGELRAIVARDRQRHGDLTCMWDEMTEAEQDHLLATAAAIIRRASVAS